MFSIEFFVSAILTILLVILDKVGKLNLTTLIILFLLAVLLAIHPSVSNPWVKAASSPAWKYWRASSTLAIVFLGFSAMGIWLFSGRHILGPESVVVASQNQQQEQPKQEQSKKSDAPKRPKSDIQQTSQGNNSPNVVGDNNTIIYGNTVLPPKSTPRFHEKPVEAYRFSIGTNGVTASANLEMLRLGNRPFSGFPLQVFAKDDDKIHYSIVVWTGSAPLEIVDGEFALQDPYADRNYNDDALEIVDNHQNPILQVIWKTPSHLVVNGIFKVGNGEIVIADEKGYRPFQIGDSIKPLFKYPSYRFKGQYANSN